jgi:hypothetical protein
MSPTATLPAFVAILGKILVLIDQALESFVTVSWIDEAGNGAIPCAPALITTQITACGAQLADLWEKAIFQVSALAVYIMAALGANVA